MELAARSLTHPSSRVQSWAAAAVDALRRLRHAPDSRLHPYRRAAALARLRAEPLPVSILFVCEGNIYRSPFAAGALRALLPPEAREVVRVASAGVVGPGRPAPPAGMAAAARRGVDLSAHRSTPLTHAAVYGARLVVVMEPRQAWRVRMRYGDESWMVRLVLRMRYGVLGARVLVMGDLDPLPIRTRAISDPWEEDEEVLEAAYARVGRCAVVMAQALCGDPSSAA